MDETHKKRFNSTTKRLNYLLVNSKKKNLRIYEKAIL